MKNNKPKYERQEQQHFFFLSLDSFIDDLNEREFDDMARNREEDEWAATATK